MQLHPFAIEKGPFCEKRTAYISSFIENQGIEITHIAQLINLCDEAQREGAGHAIKYIFRIILAIAAAIVLLKGLYMACGIFSAEIQEAIRIPLISIETLFVLAGAIFAIKAFCHLASQNEKLHILRHDMKIASCNKAVETRNGIRSTKQDCNANEKKQLWMSNASSKSLKNGTPDCRTKQEFDSPYRQTQKIGKLAQGSSNYRNSLNRAV